MRAHDSLSSHCLAFFLSGYIGRDRRAFFFFDFPSVGIGSSPSFFFFWPIPFLLSTTWFIFWRRFTSTPIFAELLALTPVLRMPRLVIYCCFFLFGEVKNDITLSLRSRGAGSMLKFSLSLLLVLSMMTGRKDFLPPHIRWKSSVISCTMSPREQNFTLFFLAIFPKLNRTLRS